MPLLEQQTEMSQFQPLKQSYQAYVIVFSYDTVKLHKVEAAGTSSKHQEELFCPGKMGKSYWILHI